MKIRITSALLALLFGGCSASASDAERTVIVLDGTIDDSAAEQISDQIASHPKDTVLLRIRSTGGDALAAMRLGDVMVEYGVAMTISQYCQSACAQYLIPSASSVQIEGSASVAFHGSPAWLVNVQDAPDDLKRSYAFFRQREESFMQTRGVDYVSYLWVQQNKRPMCWFENSDAPASSLDRYGIASRVHLVVPSHETFQQLGIANISGSFPQSLREAWQFAVESGFREEIYVSFVPALRVPDDWVFPSLTKCDDETQSALGL